MEMVLHTACTPSPSAIHPNASPCVNGYRRDVVRERSAIYRIIVADAGDFVISATPIRNS